MTVAIWDTAGQDRFKVLTRGYYRGSHGAMIGTPYAFDRPYSYYLYCLLSQLTIMLCPVYDITNMTSFEHAAKWLDELVSSVDDEILVVRYG